MVQTHEEIIHRYSRLVQEGELTIAEALTKLGNEFPGTSDEDHALHVMAHLDHVNNVTAALPSINVARLSSSLIEKWGSAAAAADEFGSEIRKAWLAERGREARHRAEQLV